jgi:site-specific recombinase XerD
VSVTAGTATGRNRDDLLLDDAIDEYLASITTFASRTQYDYRKVLIKLAAAFPNSRLREFEPPEGTRRGRAVLAKTWGSHAIRTYNRSVSVFRGFFAWHVERGNLDDDPGNGLERKETESESRSFFTREECERILRMNPHPRDAVPLRLLFLVGIQNATLRRLRFRDFDATSKTVVFTLSGDRAHPLEIEDETFWTEFQKLRQLRRANDEDFVLPAEMSRKCDPSSKEIAEMEATGALDGGRRYLWKRHNGRWMRATIDAKRPRREHGAHKWWYRCLWRAQIVPPETENGHPMSKARLTVGRSLFVEDGRKELQRVFGIARGGSAAPYENRDADELDETLRRVRHQLRPIAASQQSWKTPVGALIEYIAEERDLIELSRVSIEMLRAEDPTSTALQDAAGTLIRVVRPAKLIERARRESTGDHPLLHGHSLVAIWSALETMAIDAADAWLAKFGPAANQQRSTRTGIDRFEQLLDPVGLSGTCDPVLAQNIYEMQQIRHVFAHKRGIADRRFAVTACPHLGYAPGERIVIDRHTWSDFLLNALLYSEVVLKRMKRRLGMPINARSPVGRPIRYA